MNEEKLPTVLGDVIDCMHDGLFLVGEDGRVLLANDALLELTGFEREEIVGKPCTMFRCDECSRHLAPGDGHWCRLFATGSDIRRRCHMYTKDGRRLTVLKSSRLVRDAEGAVLAAVANVTDIGDLVEAERRIVDIESRLKVTGDFHGMVGRSSAMGRLFALVEKAAQSDAAVIIHGESGVGKELVARAIHELGPRANEPFVRCNCAAFNDSLLESELFGHVRGAFTGAVHDRVGRFEEAGEGNLFLDEVGDIPLATQVKLLRVLENREFERVGDNRTLAMDARVISATNQDLQGLIQQRRFRQDFYFRINVVPLFVPPLRERREDVPLLVEHFVRRLREQTGRDIETVSHAALDHLVAHDWPGNVRELRSVLEYAFVVCPGGEITEQHLPRLGVQEVFVAAGPVDDVASGGTGGEEEAAWTSRERAQRRELIEALRASGGNKSAAARVLGVTRLTVLNRMRKYGVRPEIVFG